MTATRRARWGGTSRSDGDDGADANPERPPPRSPRSHPTTPTTSGHDDARRGARWRALFAVVLVAFLVAAALNVFGVKSATVAAEGGGYSLEVTFAEVSRPGLATPWSVEVRTDDGRPLPEQITLTTTSSYLEMFDENGFDPDPDSSTTDAERSIWTFTTEPGSDVLVVSYDFRLEPGIQPAGSATTELLDEEGEVLVAVDYETRVMP
jgi:hypothetical protein